MISWIVISLIIGYINDDAKCGWSAFWGILLFGLTLNS